jgi:hypothetical protein
VSEPFRRTSIDRSSGPLRYLALSTMIEPEVAVSPDSKQIGEGEG